MTVLSRRHWIPPGALIYAQLAHGFSWVLILWAVSSGNLQNPFYGFAWIHTVALAWITMAALAILIHAMPNFVDVPWRAETPARWSLAAYGAGVALLIFGFLQNKSFLAIGGGLILLSLLVYLGTAFATVGSAMSGGRTQRAVARAFVATFGFLLVAAVIGFGLATMLAGHPIKWLAVPPAAHANLGMLGWLSLLVFGLSMRTLRPITGGQTSRYWWTHIIVASASLIAVPILATGLALDMAPLSWAGASLFGLAALVYSADVLDIIGRARNRHRPPQAFIVAGVAWFLASLVIGAGVLGGRNWQQAYGFLLLMGFIGQFVNAHIYHIGIRLLSTVYRGEEDETRPQELLGPPLSWLSFCSLQIAVGLVTTGLLGSFAAYVTVGAVIGLAGWIVMLANILVARKRAQRTVYAMT